MKLRGKHLMSFCLMGIGAGVIITAMSWPIKAGLFPLIISIPIFIMAAIDFVQDLFEKEEKAEKDTTMDFKPSSGGLDHSTEVRRTLTIFMWIISLFGLILLLGFPIGGPLFVLLFLKLRAREKWRVSLAITGSAWIFFHGLFVWLLNTPFQEGWLTGGLRRLMGF